MSQTRVLVVEDDAAIRRGLVDALEFQGYQTIEAGDGEAAVAQALESAPDLVILDCMLPKQSGFDALKAIRASRPTLPVIMVTALGAENERVTGLSLGADDYIVKPFSLRELLARVEAVLRRSPGRPLDVTQLSDGAVTVDLARRVVEAVSNGQGAPVSSPASERAASESSISERDVGILRHLAAHRTRVVERDELLQVVWGLDPRNLETRTVDMQIARLRERIASAGARSEWIATARGKGYRLGSEITVR
ncbi:MAG: response regulator transcription factor [Phycisphaeraceae bacterium]|nr:response regulator transcription factor [Phycisphaeraceae bacterium]